MYNVKFRTTANVSQTSLIGPVSTKSILDAQYPVVDWVGSYAMVGSAPPYKHYRNDGSAWVEQLDVSSISSAGLTLVQSIDAKAQRNVLGLSNALTMPGSQAFPYIGLFFALRSTLPTFGNSVADTSKSRSATTTYYYSPTGNAANTGLSHTSPKPIPTTGPWYLTASNAKYMIQAGSTVTVQMVPTGSPVTISVYNPSTGAEILDQPNPFILATLGGWVSDSQIASKYFNIEYAVDPATSTLTSSAVSGGSCADLLLRGANLIGSGTANGFYTQNATKCRLEDVVISGFSIPAQSRADKNGGIAIRLNGASGGAPVVTRAWIKHNGEDVIHAVNQGSSYPLTLTDSAIIHTCDSCYYRSQHTDVWQMEANPGDFIARRCVIRHILKTPTVVDDTSGLTSAVGGGIVTVGTASPTIYAGLVEDCLIFTSSQAFNIQSSGVVFNRVIGICEPSIHATQAMLAWQRPVTETDCIWAIVDASAGAYVRYEPGGSGTKTNVVDIPSFSG